MTRLLAAVRGYLVRALAFMRRDFREAVSYRLAFVMQLYSIFFSVTLFYFIAKILGGAATPALTPYGGEYFPFVLVGLAFMGFFQTGMSVFAGSVRQGQVTGTLEAMLVTPTPLGTVVTASAVGAFARSALNVLLYLLIGTLFGFDPSGANWLVTVLILALSVTAFSGLGIVSAAFVLAFKKGNPAAALFGAMSSLVSGVFFPVELLPSWLQYLSKAMPLTYALEAMRRALMGAELGELTTELLALAGFSAVLTPLAVVAFRMAVQYAKREGSLAHY